jgi:hypothetical protein
VFRNHIRELDPSWVISSSSGHRIRGARETTSPVFFKIERIRVIVLISSINAAPPLTLSKRLYSVLTASWNYKSQEAKEESLICSGVSIEMASLCPFPYHLSSIFIPPKKRVPVEIVCFSHFSSLSNVRRAVFGCSSLFRLITRLYVFFFIISLFIFLLIFKISSN